jgi:photosystem II stability/assembly factor-like uncharacterized protein
MLASDNNMGMNKQTVIIIILFILPILNSYGQWTQQVSGTNQQLWSLDIIDNQTAYASVDLGGTIKTTDGGLNWVPFPNFTGNWLEFLDPDTAFGFTMDTQMHLQKSVDGGLNWQTKTSSLGGFGRFHFPNSTVGYLTGMSDDNDSLLFFKSTNGGETWNYLNGYYMITQYFGSLYFIDANTGFYTDDLGRLYRTSNGGVNWNLVYTTATGAYINAIDFPSSSIGYAVTDVSFLKSTDGGQSWNETNLAFTGAFLDIDCPNINTCHIVGGDGFSTGSLITTFNGGANWSSTPVPCDLLWDVDFLNDTLGYACGIAGTILTYNGSGMSVENEAYTPYTLFPNPATNFITIQSNDVSINKIDISVYDPTGNIVLTLHEQLINQPLNVAHLQTGTYFIQLHSGQYKFRWKKLFIIR